MCSRKERKYHKLTREKIGKCCTNDKEDHMEKANVVRSCEEDGRLAGDTKSGR